MFCIFFIGKWSKLFGLDLEDSPTVKISSKVQRTFTVTYILSTNKMFT